MEREFLNRIRKTIERYEMLKPGDKVVVGVSGGPDSIALLNALDMLKNCYQLSLWAAHYNHKLRGEESAREAEFVNSQAKTIGVPLFLGEDDGSLFEKQPNLEERSREQRYKFFRRVASEIGAQKVALGHTANDQAETFFLWVFRGSGSKGLGGMPPVREGFFIRPLIEMERKEIIAFLQGEGIPWVEDSSNQRRRYLRNRIRHFLIPKLIHDFDANLIKKIIKTTEILRDEELFLEKLSLEKFIELRKKEGRENALYIEITEFEKLPVSLRRRIVRHAIREIKGSLRRINFSHIEAILGVIKSQAPNLKLSLPGDFEVCKEYNHLKFRGLSRKKVCFCHEFVFLPKEIRIPEIDRKIGIEILDWNPGHLFINSKSSALMDWDKLKFPLVVRNWKEGDRFQPLGMRTSKKVKDFFIDLKLPTNERQNTPIVLFGDLVAWIGGQRIDDRVKLTDSTKKVIRMEIY